MLLEIAGINKSTYFYAIKTIDYKQNKDAEIGDLIEDIFNRNYQKYGRPRIVQELKRQGLVVNNKKVYRIMKERDLTAVARKRRYNSYRGEMGKKCHNHLLKKKIDKEKQIFVYERIFKTDRPYQILGTDITQFRIAEGKLYLSPVIDFHTREILGYDISTSPNYAQVRRMLKMMIARHGNVFSGAILHSDQGYQYQVKEYQLELQGLGIIQSMSRKGNVLDNSPTENFFGRLKTELFNDKEFKYKSIKELKKDIEKYIEYYNQERIVVKYGESPINIRQTFQNMSK